MAKIRYIARYLIHSANKNDEDAYKEIVQWLQKYHDNFDESGYSNVISDAIKGAYKYPFYIIDNTHKIEFFTKISFIHIRKNRHRKSGVFHYYCLRLRHNNRYHKIYVP